MVETTAGLYRAEGDWATEQQQVNQIAPGLESGYKSKSGRLAWPLQQASKGAWQSWARPVLDGDKDAQGVSGCGAPNSLRYERRSQLVDRVAADEEQMRRLRCLQVGAVPEY
jgi:hypothetical protein